MKYNGNYVTILIPRPVNLPYNGMEDVQVEIQNGSEF